MHVSSNIKYACFKKKKNRKGKSDIFNITSTICILYSFLVKVESHILKIEVYDRKVLILNFQNLLFLPASETILISILFNKNTAKLIVVRVFIDNTII